MYAMEENGRSRKGKHPLEQSNWGLEEQWGWRRSKLEDSTEAYLGLRCRLAEGQRPDKSSRTRWRTTTRLVPLIGGKNTSPHCHVNWVESNEASPQDCLILDTTQEDDSTPRASTFWFLPSGTDQVLWEERRKEEVAPSGVLSALHTASTWLGICSICWREERRIAHCLFIPADQLERVSARRALFGKWFALVCQTGEREVWVFFFSFHFRF